MCAAAGPSLWSPGAVCWREDFEIHWWDVTCLSVVSSLKVTAEVVLLPLQPQPQCLVLENVIIHGSLRHV
jgi:hypothetical protein